MTHGLSCPVAWEILVPQPGIEPMSPALEGGFIATGSPGKSLKVYFFLFILEGYLCFCRLPLGSSSLSGLWRCYLTVFGSHCFIWEASHQSSGSFSLCLPLRLRLCCLPCSTQSVSLEGVRRNLGGGLGGLLLWPWTLHTSQRKP